MFIRQAIQSGKFIVTTEVAPPRGADFDDMVANAQLCADCVDATNVTDIPHATLRASSLAGCIKLKQAGMRPIMQMVCRDRNRLSLQSELLSAAAMGITDVLCMTGDYPTLGDHPQAKPVFDLDSVQLIQVARGLCEGHDMMGHPLHGAAPDFCLGCVVNPGSEPLELQIMKLHKKIRAGAEFVQTQAVYDPEVLLRFVDAVGDIGVPVIAGIVMLKSARTGQFLDKHVPGVHVPDDLIARLENSSDREETSIEITCELIERFKPMVRGVHIMPIGWHRQCAEVLKRCPI